MKPKEIQIPSPDTKLAEQIKKYETTLKTRN